MKPKISPYNFIVIAIRILLIAPFAVLVNIGIIAENIGIALGDALPKVDWED